MTVREFKERLSRRAKRAGVAVPAALADRLWIYFQLLTKWNAKINLTGLDLDDPTPEAIDRLLIEPLVAAPHGEGSRSLIDIGSGGGSPALPLALALGDVRLAMIEVKTRKSVFLREAARELGLDDAVVVTARHESLLSDPTFHDAFDLLSVRAVRVDPKVFAALQVFVRPGGRLLHFQSTAEIKVPLLPPPLELEGAFGLGESSQNRLLVMDKSPRNVPRGTSPDISSRSVPRGTPPRNGLT
jgi:16S rRNA (guanine527-N7)-methyltransferase